MKIQNKQVLNIVQVKIKFKKIILFVFLPIKHAQYFFLKTFEFHLENMKKKGE